MHIERNSFEEFMRDLFLAERTIEDSARLIVDTHDDDDEPVDVLDNVERAFAEMRR
jgi:hypothetical protein